MTPEQVQFCYDIAQGRQDLASGRLFRVEIVPQNEIFKKSDFKFLPAIFCLWAAGQYSPQVIAKKLQLLYPKAMPADFKPGNIKHIHEAIQEYVFPLVKSSFVPLLQNFATLAVARHDGMGEDEEQRFKLVASAGALHLILHHEFFANMPARKLAQTIYEKLKLRVDLSNFENQLSSFSQMKTNVDEKPLPDAIKSLIAALNSQSRPELQLEFGRTYLASGGIKRIQSPYFPTRREEERQQLEEKKSFLMNPVH